MDETQDATDDGKDDGKDDGVRILAALINCDLRSDDHLKRFGEQAGPNLNVRWTQEELLTLQELVQLIASSIRDGRDGQLLRARIVIRAMIDHQLHLTQRRLFVIKMVRANSEQFLRSIELTRVLMCDECGRSIPYTHIVQDHCETVFNDDLLCNGSLRESTIDMTSQERNRVANSLIASLRDIEPKFGTLDTRAVCAVLQKGWSPARAAAEFCQMVDAFDDKEKGTRKGAKLFDEIWRQAVKKQADRNAIAGVASAYDDDDIDIAW